MMTAKVKQRLVVIALVGIALSAATGLTLFGLSGALSYFVTPSEILADDNLTDRPVSVGGLVTIGSVRNNRGVLIFQLEDDENAITVEYSGQSGPTPDLFREGQCVIAQGQVDQATRVLKARRIMAKHDETYTPREIEAAPRLARSCGTAGGAGDGMRRS